MGPRGGTPGWHVLGRETPEARALVHEAVAAYKAIRANHAALPDAVRDAGVGRFRERRGPWG
ncbi:hypothetical protein ABZT28_29350 [Streptomyces sp. NPDC005388]|uniref:hypothetical protein n=1 Tax=Streptomyces sp. NPDC005388 TaxID=3156717 RepID=UPI0033BBD730